MSTKTALRFKGADIARQKNEKVRLKVIQGPDKGAIFIVVGSRANIGRDENCSIHLTDLKSSRRHAEIFASDKGWVVQDSGSANGLLHNSKSVNRSVLSQGDTIQVGQTIMQVFFPDAATSLLRAPAGSLEQVNRDARLGEKQRSRVHSMVSFGGMAKAASKASAVPGASQEKRKRILMLVVAGLAVWTLLDEMEPSQTSSKNIAKNSSNAVQGKDTNRQRQLATFLPGEPSTEVKTASDKFFRVGFREFREKNYIRARVNFETVLQIHPTHELAKMYLDNCNSAIKNEVKFHLSRGKRAFDAGKLNAALGHYETITRLLYRDKDSPNYLEASQRIEEIEKIQKGEI